jgi:hypothetical protein
MLSESSAAGYASLRRSSGSDPFVPFELRGKISRTPSLFSNMFLYAVIHLEVF